MMTIVTTISRSLRTQTKLAIVAVLACSGILYLAPKVPPPSTMDPLDYFDFQAFWLVGKIWASGQNPYDVALFQTQFYEMFNRSAGQLMWVYPPYWYPIFVPFAFLSFKVAFGIWKVINFALLIGATHLVARALADVTRQKYLLIFLSGIAIVCFMRATPMTIWGGQTSVFVYFGLSAMIFGLLKDRPSWLIIGLLFLALKPQIGVIAFAAVVVLRRYRWTILPAAGLCLLGTVPVLFAGGLRASIEGFLANLSLQSRSVSLGPDLVTGLIHFANYQSYISNRFLVGLTIMLTAILSALVVFYNSSFNAAQKGDDVKHQIATIVLLVSIIFFFTPLHSYDLVSLAAIWMIILAVSLSGRWAIVIGLILCFRPENVLDAIRVATSEKILLPIGGLVSVGLLLLFIGAVWSELVRPPEYEKAARLIEKGNDITV